MQVIFFCLSLLIAVYSAPIYVNVAAGSGGTGSSWATAFNNLQSALNIATASSNEIWVAKGTYLPSVPYTQGYTGSEPNLVTFLLTNNTAIYGGFAGTETARSQRNIVANPTILSGDLNADDSSGNLTDNAWHIMTADNIHDCRVDGFTVVGGHAAGPDAGVVAVIARSSTIVSIAYTHAAGSGCIALHGATMRFANCIFVNNSLDSSRATMVTVNFPIEPIAATGAGIGIIGIGTLVTVTSCTFTNNLAIVNGTQGGAIGTLLNASVTISSSVFNGNQGNRIGGALYSRTGNNMIVTSSTFTGNKVVGVFAGDESGGAIGIFQGYLTVTSCVFNGNLAQSVFGAGGAIIFHIPFDNGVPYTATITSSTFSNNICSTSGGGAISFFTIIANTGTKATVTSCVFNSNVGGVGGALYVDSVPTTITACTFNGNKAWTNGGAIFSTGFSSSIFNVTQFTDRMSCNITACTFNGNSLIGISGLPPLFIFNIFAEIFSSIFGPAPSNVTILEFGGGAIASSMGARTYVVASQFVNNNATIGFGGAILVGGSVGTAGAVPEGMNQAFLSITSSSGSSNIDSTGSNNVAVLNSAGLPAGINNVYFVTDGSM